jgi:hypothetical protein
MIALVVGGSERVWEEYAAAKALCTGLAVTTFVTNSAIAEFPDHIDHAVTLHPYEAKLGRWLTERNSRGLNRPARIWSKPPELPLIRRRGADYRWPHVTDTSQAPWGISSGTFAVKIARELGFAKIILAGVPLTEAGGHFKRHRIWKWAPTPQRQCAQQLDELKPFVRSMSGWTLEQFGLPGRDWLQDVTEVQCEPFSPRSLFVCSLKRQTRSRGS